MNIKYFHFVFIVIAFLMIFTTDLAFGSSPGDRTEGRQEGAHCSALEKILGLKNLLVHLVA